MPKLTNLKITIIMFQMDILTFWKNHSVCTLYKMYLSANKNNLIQFQIDRTILISPNYRSELVMGPTLIIERLCF